MASGAMSFEEKLRARLNDVSQPLQALLDFAHGTDAAARHAGARWEVSWGQPGPHLARVPEWQPSWFVRLGVNFAFCGRSQPEINLSKTLNRFQKS